MPKVTYNGTTYECDVAIKGSDYVHLMDANNDMVVAFDGVVDFSAFTIAEGSWTTPTPNNDCYLAVVGDDGVIRKGNSRSSDVGKALSSVGNAGMYTSDFYLFITGQHPILCAHPYRGIGI